ncbi:MAG: hypothetical protein NVS1B13_23340 [Flavisolibacter sp.]
MLDTGLTLTKDQFIQNWVFYDSSFITPTDLNKFSSQAVFNRFENSSDNLPIIYWTFLNTRVYFLLFLSFIVAFSITKNVGALKRWMMMSLGPAAILAYLFFFMKTTIGMYLTFFSAFILAGFVTLNNLNNKKTSFWFMWPILIFICCGWMSVRLYKMNSQNLEAIAGTRCFLNGLKSKPESLFITTTLEFNGNGFYIWDLPSQFPLDNVINKERDITRSYKGTLAKFKIKDLLRELPAHNNIILLGETQLYWQSYYLQRFNLSTEFITLPPISCVKAYKIGLKIKSK